MPAPHPFIDEIRPLDEAACTALGHVRYFTGTDAVTTLSAMFSALAKWPINAALWADAEQTLDPVMLDHLRTWRKMPGERTSQIPRSARSVYLSCDETKQHIAALFDDYACTTKAAPEVISALDHVRDHIRGRIASLQQIFPDAILNVDFRMENNHRLLNLHTDGHHTKVIRTLRILEPLNSDGTILCDNRDFNFGSGINYDLHRPWAQPVCRHDHDRVPVAYQAPSNSLLIITNDLHHSAPIVHCSPAGHPDRPDSLKREVVCYDLAIPMDWYKTFKPS